MRTVVSAVILAAAVTALAPGSSSAQTVALRADFDQSTVGEQPPTDLPGDPVGDFLVFRTSAGSITVQDAFGAMTDQPLVMNRTTTGSFSLSYNLIPAVDTCGSYSMQWTGMITEDTSNLAINFRSASNSTLAQLAYRSGGVLAYNGFTNELDVGFQPNVPQIFEITIDIPTKTTSLSIDGVPVPDAQNVNFVQSILATEFDSAIFAMGGLDYEEYVMDDVLVTAFGCEVPIETKSWSTLKASF